jgi:hypothetical protein
MMLAALLATAACLATPVQGDVVRAGPFTGGISRQYDVVDGRFRLHVGDYRDEVTGLSQKIPWFVPRRSRVGGSVLVVGRRLGSTRRIFKDVLHEAWSPSDPDQRVFPSSFSPPSAGCLRLTFTSRRVKATLTVLVSDEP